MGGDAIPYLFCLFAGLCAVFLVAAIARGIALGTTECAASGPLAAIRKRTATLAFFLPLFSLVWMCVTFVQYGATNATYFDRDSGIFTLPRVPLNNDYIMLFAGHLPAVFPKGADTNWIMDVERLQVDGPTMLGRIGEHYNADGHPASSYFIVDAPTRVRTNFATEEQLRAAAAKRGIALKLRDTGAIYRENRFTWFDGLAAIVLFGVPLWGMWLLIRSIVRLRKGAPSQLPLA
jgi:hypothetical protein